MTARSAMQLSFTRWKEGEVIDGKIGKRIKLYLFKLGLKRCGRCHRLLSLKDFGQDQSSTFGLAVYCNKCKQDVDKEYYHAAKDRITRDRWNQKAKVIQLMGGFCHRCGYKEFSSALICHHIEPNQKEYTITELIGGRRLEVSSEVVLAELDKCILLCSNCHRGLHAGEWQAEFAKCDGLGWEIVNGK